MDFTSTLKKLLKHCISAEFLLVEGYLQGALRKELRIAPFALKQLLWEGLTDAFSQYLEQFTLTLHFCRFFAGKRLCTRCSTKGAAYYSFCRML